MGGGDWPQKWAVSAPEMQLTFPTYNWLVTCLVTMSVEHHFFLNPAL